MHTFTLLFFYRKAKQRKDGTVPLYARITVNGQRAEFALKRYILPQQWDAQKGKPVSRRGKEKELQAYLESIRAKLYRHHREFQDRDETFTARDLKSAFLGLIAIREKA